MGAEGAALAPFKEMSGLNYLALQICVSSPDAGDRPAATTMHQISVKLRSSGAVADWCFCKELGRVNDAHLHCGALLGREVDPRQLCILACYQRCDESRHIWERARRRLQLQEGGALRY